MEKVKTWMLAHRSLVYLFQFLFYCFACILGLVVAVASLPIERVGSNGFFGAVVFGEALCALASLFVDLISDK